MSAPALTYRDVVRLLKAIPERRSSANPMLSHVLCEPVGAAVRLTVIATEQRFNGVDGACGPSAVLYARWTLPAAGPDLTGPVAIPAAALVAALTRCHGMPALAGPHGEAPALTVRLDGATVPALDPLDFPAIPSALPDAAPAAWLPAAAAVLPACSTDTTRTGLTAVHASAGAAGLRFAATDGHRLYLATAPGTLPGDGFMLPPAWIKIAAALPVQSVACDPGNPRNPAAPAGRIEASGRGFVVGALAQDGEFPDWRQVVPGAQPRSLTVETATLRAPLKRALDVVSDKCSAVRLVCGVPGCPALRLMASGDGGAIDLPIDGAEYSGEPLTFGLNARYALDALTFVDGDAVQLGIGDALSPVLVASARTDRLAVVMPQRIE